MNINRIHRKKSLDGIRKKKASAKSEIFGNQMEYNRKRRRKTLVGNGSWIAE